MAIKLRIFSFFLVLTILAYFEFTKQSKFENLQTKHKFRIYRDQHGVPRIYARDKASAYYGLGFAQAQDRLWTLHVRKKVVQGRLAQIFGSGALQLDLQNRNYDFYRVGKRNAEGIKGQQKQLAQAYCDGVNDYAKNVDFLPFEFYLAFTKWEDWQISDTLSMVALLSFALDFDWMYQIARQRLLETVGFDLAWKMIAFGDDNLFRQVTIINNEQLKERGRYVKYDSRVIQEILKQHWVNKAIPLGSVHLPSSEYQSLGSNAWAIGGQHTKSGKPLLANDPHLGLIIPALFYLAEMNIVNDNNQVTFTVFGAKSDGIPTISLGLNNKFAWGSTASYADNKDVFHQTVRQSNGAMQYLFKDQWHPFQVRRQVFQVRGQGQFVKQFYHTHRGPVIQHIFDDLHVKYGFPINKNYRFNHTLTLASSIYDPDYTTLKAFIGLPFSQSFEQFQDFSQLVNGPNIDSAFITQNGTFGYGGIGRIPKRKIPQMGGFIKDGTTDLYDMGQYLTWKEMPKLRNPKKGYIAMANNKFAEDSFDTRSSIHEVSTGRSYRLQKIITEKIKKKQKFTIEDMKKMQLDNRDEFLSEAFPILLQALDKVRYIWQDEQTSIYFNLLKKWDYHMPINSIEATIYHVYEHHFHETLLHNTNLTQQERLAILNHAFFQVYFMKLHQKIGKFNLTQEEATICANNENSNYTNIHPCLANAALTFKKLPKFLFELFNTKDVTKYEWGIIHKHTFKTVPWSDIPLLNKIWGRETPAAGNSRTVNVAILTHQTKSYNSIAGPVVRFITDLNQTYFSIDTGETDRVTSQFYDNFLGKDMYVKYTKHNPIKGEEVNWEMLVDRI